MSLAFCERRIVRLEHLERGCDAAANGGLRAEFERGSHRVPLQIADVRLHERLLLVAGRHRKRGKRRQRVADAGLRQAARSVQRVVQGDAAERLALVVAHIVRAGRRPSGLCAASHRIPARRGRCDRRAARVRRSRACGARVVRMCSAPMYGLNRLADRLKRIAYCALLDRSESNC